jgi:hypothetical protein
MSALDSINLAWFPLVPRPRPPGRTLEERVADLAALAESTTEGSPQERVTRASESLNKAALIASDCGVPDLAHDFCHRHYALFAAKAPLPAWAARLVLQPILNISRQLIRESRPPPTPTPSSKLFTARQPVAPPRPSTAL